MYRQEIKSGDYITWEVSLDHLSSGNAVLLPSVVYRNVKVEPEDAGAKWVGDKSNTSGDASTATGGESKSGEDDFQVTTSEKSALSEDSKKEQVSLPGEPLFLTPLVGLQPCPLVFFRDDWGDVCSFRFYWFQLPYHLPPIKIAETAAEQVVPPMDRKVADMAALNWDGEAVPGGFATKVWAFATFRGSRVSCVLAETDGSNKSPRGQHLYWRGDDKTLLYSLAGSKKARETVVAALCPGLAPVI